MEASKKKKKKKAYQGGQSNQELLMRKARQGLKTNYVKVIYGPHNSSLGGLLVVKA